MQIRCVVIKGFVSTQHWDFLGSAHFGKSQLYTLGCSQSLMFSLGVLLKQIVEEITQLLSVLLDLANVWILLSLLLMLLVQKLKNAVMNQKFNDNVLTIGKSKFVFIKSSPLPPNPTQMAIYV